MAPRGERGGRREAAPPPPDSGPARPTRRYHSPRRAEQAAATRGAVLAAARELFVRDGYLATTIADVARRAGVAVDTVYATVGRKPDLLRAVLESALSGGDDAVPAEQRDYVRDVRAASTLEDKITAYVTGLIAVLDRLAPVHLAILEASRTDADSAALWDEISTRRARNMRDFAADLRGTGEVREDLTDEDIADIVWSMNGPEYWALLVRQRRWTPQRFAAHLIEAWSRILRR